jgi:hypothetical protein
MDVLSRMYNFTFVSDRDVAGDWGTLPKSGPMNLSGEWGGVMGGVIKGEYDLSISSWGRNVDRSHLMTFSSVVPVKEVLVLTPKKQGTRFTNLS